MTAAPLLDAVARLADVAPAAAARARPVMAEVLAAVCRTAMPEAAGCFSRLTPDGYPAELSFVTGQPGSVRWTAEVAGPETPGQDRLRIAGDLLDRLGHRLPDPAAAALSGVQKGQSLRWGAWVGLRHGENGDRAKIYVEVPPLAPDAEAALGRALTGAPVPRPPGAERLRMAGYEPSTGRAEFYWRLGPLDFPRLAGILRLGRAGASLPRMTAVLRLLAGEPAGGPARPLPTARFGGSVARRAGADRTEVAVFAAAADLAGHDGRVRCRVDAALAHLGAALPGYHRLAPGPADPPGRHAPRHVMLGLAPAGAHLALSVSLRPAPATVVTHPLPDHEN
ncbi:hypothetical protein KOI35_30810 [Actinoplanes bogorensis]|uniref:Uncharacterized protein n=1 Tax=Paractinoplanes bogorensis TaxID=1610840 RepID=A0ABS5YXW5_9ACTN|nr:hypothetical protein [Actinoplanes bogorensis]MBU2667911.1 hypothetical protein [Actinoplanes bogorensis]